MQRSRIFLKRLRLNLLTLRFWAGCLLLFLLSVPAVLSSIEEYSRRWTLYAARRDADLSEMKSDFVVMYARTQMILHRPPEQLSILARGLGEQFGSVVTLRGKYGPSKITSRDRSNFFLPVSAAFDYAFITAVGLSLMAMFLAYDAVTGEREQGTLQLVLANTIPRYKVLLGEYWGAMVSVAIPSVAVFFVVIIVIHLQGVLEFDRDVNLRLLCFLLYSILLISTFVWLGLGVSSTVHSSSTALVVGFLLWVTFVVLYPSVAAWGCHYLKPLDKIPAVNPENIMAQASEYFPSQPLGGVTERQKEIYRNRNLEQANLVNQLWLFSPFSNFMLVSQGVAGTDLGSHHRFLQQARALEQAFIQWQEAKVRQYPQRERTYMQAFGPLDLSEMPAAEYQPESVASLLTRLLPAITIMVLWNIILFAVVHAMFIRYDPRFS